MKKFTKISLIVLGLLFLLLFFLPNFLNLNSIKFKINDASNSFFKTELEQEYADQNIYFNINGNVDLKIFPFPRLVFNNVEAKNLRFGDSLINFKIPKTELKISLFRLFFGKVSVQEVEVINASYYLRQTSKDSQLSTRMGVIAEDINSLDMTKGKILNLYEFVKDKITTKNNLLLSNIKVNLRNNEIIARTFLSNLELSNANLSLNFGDGFTLNGRTKLNGKTVNIKSNSNNNSRRQEYSGDISIFSPIIKWTFKYKGAYENPIGLNNLKMTSESLLEVKDIQLFVKWFFEERSWGYKKIISEDELKVGFKFLYDSGDFHIQNIKINSLNLNGEGNLIYDSKNKGESQFVFAFSDINLDKLITKGFASDKQLTSEDIRISNEAKNSLSVKQGEIAYASFFKYPIFRKSDFKIDFKINKLLYNEQTISNLEFGANTTNNGLLKLRNFSFDLPQNGKFILNGQGNYGYNGAGFLGKMAIQGENLRNLLTILLIKTSHVTSDYLKGYSFSSDISVLRDKVSLKNAKLIFDDVICAGNIDIALERGIKYIILDVNIDKLDLERYIVNKAQSFVTGMTLKEKLLWLNSFNMNTLLKLNIQNLIYKNFSEKNYKLNINYGQGFLRFYDLNLNSADFKLKGSFDFDIRAQTPKINANLYFDKLNLFSQKSRNSIQIKNQSDLQISTTEEQQENKENQMPQDIVDIFLSAPSIHGFDGSINLVIKQGNIQGIDINNLQFNSILENGRLEFKQFNFRAFDGNFKIQGNSDIRQQKSINMVFDGCIFESAEILKYLTGKDNIKRKIAVSGILNSDGSHRKEFLDKMLGKFTIKGIGAEVNEFGLKDLMLEMFHIYKDKELLAQFNPLNILYDKDRNTIFTDINGLLQIKDTKTTFKFDLRGVAITGIYSGEIIDSQLDSLSTFIFLTGTKTKQIPISLSITTAGDLRNLKSNTNMSQVDEYINNLKNIINVSEVTEDEFNKNLIDSSNSSMENLRIIPETTNQINDIISELDDMPEQTLDDIFNLNMYEVDLDNMTPQDELN
jgi:hypothetical protein